MSRSEQTGPQRERHPVAGDRRRVRRRGEDLPEPARGEHDGPGGHDADRGDEAGFVEHGDPNPGSLARPVGSRSEDEVERERPAQHLDTGTDRRFVEGSLHLGTRLVAAGVHDPVVAVPALAGECDRRGRRVAVDPVGAGIERCAEPHQIADRLRRLGDQLANDGLVAQSRSRFERVAHVVLERVARIEHPGESALGPLRRPGRQDVLGHDEHAAHGACGERRREASCP